MPYADIHAPTDNNPDATGVAGGIVAALLLAVLSLAPVLAEDVATLKTRSVAGDTNAQISLGIAHRDGKGVAQDNAEALAWFRKAAEKNDAAAFDIRADCPRTRGTTK